VEVGLDRSIFVSCVSVLSMSYSLSKSPKNRTITI
jgi:hypothetical protein